MKTAAAPGGDVWREVLQATRHSSGAYGFRVWNPPILDDDEPNYIEWSSDHPVFAAEILDQLTEGLRDRGIIEGVAPEAAEALLPHLSKVDQRLLTDSIRKMHPGSPLSVKS